VHSIATPNYYVLRTNICCYAERRHFFGRGTLSKDNKVVLLVKSPALSNGSATETAPLLKSWMPPSESEATPRIASRWPGIGVPFLEALDSSCGVNRCTRASGLSLTKCIRVHRFSLTNCIRIHRFALTSCIRIHSLFLTNCIRIHRCSCASPQSCGMRSSFSSSQSASIYVANQKHLWLWPRDSPPIQPANTPIHRCSCASPQSCGMRSSFSSSRLPSRSALSSTSPASFSGCRV